MKTRSITIYLVLGVVVLLGAYDIFAYVRGGAQATISVVLWEGSHEFPMIPFGFGVLMGHFFWQND